MTYPDPKQVRDYRFSVNLNYYERNLIHAYAEYVGAEPAALIRELAIRQAVTDLSLPSNPRDAILNNEDAFKLR
jgi:hypothetical protein